MKNFLELQQPETRKQSEKKKKKHPQTNSNFWRLNSMLLNHEWVNNEIKKEIKKLLETNENEHKTVKNLQEQS